MNGTAGSPPGRASSRRPRGGEAPGPRGHRGRSGRQDVRQGGPRLDGTSGASSRSAAATETRPRAPPIREGEVWGPRRSRAAAAVTPARDRAVAGGPRRTGRPPRGPRPLSRPTAGFPIPERPGRSDDGVPSGRRRPGRHRPAPSLVPGRRKPPARRHRVHQGSAIRGPRLPRVGPVSLASPGRQGGTRPSRPSARAPTGGLAAGPCRCGRLSARLPPSAARSSAARARRRRLGPPGRGAPPAGGPTALRRPSRRRVRPLGHRRPLPGARLPEHPCHD